MTVIRAVSKSTKLKITEISNGTSKKIYMKGVQIHPYEATQ